MMFYLSIVAGFILIILFKYAYDFISFWRFFQNLPGEKNFHVLYGNVHLSPGPNEEGMSYDLGLVTKFKTFHRLWLGPCLPILQCYHPSVLKTILKSSAPKPRNGLIASAYDMGARWLGDGLLLANGSRWGRNRRLLTPAFHFDILKNYVDVYKSCTKLLLKRLETLQEQGESFDIFQPVSLCSLDVILRSAFSYHSDCQNASKQNEYAKNLTELIALWTIRTYEPLNFIEFVYGITKEGKRFYSLCDAVHKFADEIIHKRKAALESQDIDSEKTSKVRDFLDTLILARDDEGNGLSLLEIRNEVDTFLFEGQDTTAGGMSWTLYSLATYPEFQEKVYKEVMEVYNGREELEWADLSKLEYTTMCIKEAMRFHTVVPFIERILEEPTDLDGHMIPKGTLVGIKIWDLHHNPHVWDRPHEYDPERFNSENVNKMDPFQFLPFSAGSRNCIGQNFAMNEMKIVVSSVIKNFKLEADPKEKARKFYAVTIRTENGAKIYATPR